MRKSNNTRNIWVAAGVMIIIIVLLIILIPGKAPTTEEETAANGPETLAEPEVAGQETESEVEGIVYSESELCEDYVMEQGDTLKLDGNTIRLIKIGKVSVRVSINGQEVILPVGEDVYEKGIRVKLAKNDLIFFEEDDEENRVEFTIGCKNDDDPTEKHILETIQARGEGVCKALIRTCEKEFDI